MTKIQELFVANIREARKRLGCSQMALAELCDVSTGYISEIEIGRKFPSVVILQKIADALRIEPYQLFFESDDKTDFNKKEAINSLYADLRAQMDEVVQKHLS